MISLESQLLLHSRSGGRHQSTQQVGPAWSAAFNQRCQRWACIIWMKRGYGGGGEGRSGLEVGVWWEPRGSEAGIDPSGLKTSEVVKVLSQGPQEPLFWTMGGGTPGPHPLGRWTPPYWLVPPHS